jgi:hypothetical protein
VIEVGTWAIASGAVIVTFGASRSGLGVGVPDGGGFDGGGFDGGGFDGGGLAGAVGFPHT